MFILSKFFDQKVDRFKTKHGQDFDFQDCAVSQDNKWGIHSLMTRKDLCSIEAELIYGFIECLRAWDLHKYSRFSLRLQYKLIKRFAHGESADQFLDCRSGCCQNFDEDEEKIPHCRDPAIIIQDFICVIGRFKREKFYTELPARKDFQSLDQEISNFKRDYSMENVDNDRAILNYCSEDYLLLPLEKMDFEKRKYAVCPQQLAIIEYITDRTVVADLPPSWRAKIDSLILI